MKSLQEIWDKMAALESSVELLQSGTDTIETAVSETVRESRTPITSLPFTITESGSYYLEQSMVFSAPTGNAITINAGGVTLDLNGHTLSSTAQVTGDAIYVFGSPNPTTARIKNGFIEGLSLLDYSGASIAVLRGGFRFAVHSVSNNNTTILSELVASACRETGFQIAGESQATRCTAQRNGDHGFTFSRGVTLSGCIAHANGEDGFRLNNASCVEHCRSTSNGGRGFVLGSHFAVTACLARSNRDTGFYANSSVLGTLTNSTAFLNATDDIGIANPSATRANNFPAP